MLFQEKGGTVEMLHDKWKMKYKMDNEYEVVFVVSWVQSL